MFLILINLPECPGTNSAQTKPIHIGCHIVVRKTPLNVELIFGLHGVVLFMCIQI